MKRLIFKLAFALFGLTTFSTSSQTSTSLSFADIIYGKTHTLSQTQEYLRKKGFEYLDKADFLGKATKYVFARSNENNGVQFAVVLYGESIWEVIVTMQNPNNFYAIKTKVKAEGFKLDTENKTTVDPFAEKYVKDNHVVNFSSGKNVQIRVYYEVTYW